MDDPHNLDVTQNTPKTRFEAVLRGLRVRAGRTLRELGEELHRAHGMISGLENARLPAVRETEGAIDWAATTADLEAKQIEVRGANAAQAPGAYRRPRRRSWLRTPASSGSGTP